MAHAVAKISRQVAADLRGENTELKDRVARLDEKVDQLQETVFDLRQWLMVAVFRLEANGDAASATEIRAVLNNRPPL
ncbi:hypothetical protein [Nocardia brasiliensis]|uniref:hypothetical protein n=1 Tax=Nocardia brasiliensis TaxID=37326 RepID=UPI0018935276|nr:hypothetical protein [Nocardia brasiliensis]MBF6547836.1 hypothetical protein [Nocardia brasiliensis]